jgi:hypothetical protein
MRHAIHGEGVEPDFLHSVPRELVLAPGLIARLRAELLHYGRFWQGISPAKIHGLLRPDAGSLCWRMILAENRCTLFRIMR